MGVGKETLVMGSTTTHAGEADGMVKINGVHPRRGKETPLSCIYWDFLGSTPSGSAPANTELTSGFQLIRSKNNEKENNTSHDK